MTIIEVSGMTRRYGSGKTAFEAVKALDIRNSSPSLTSDPSAASAGSGPRRRLIAPIGVGRQSISSKRALIRTAPFSGAPVTDDATGSERTSRRSLR